MAACRFFLYYREGEGRCGGEKGEKGGGASHDSSLTHTASLFPFSIQRYLALARDCVCGCSHLYGVCSWPYFTAAMAVWQMIYNVRGVAIIHGTLINKLPPLNLGHSPTIQTRQKRAECFIVVRSPHRTKSCFLPQPRGFRFIT